MKRPSEEQRRLQVSSLAIVGSRSIGDADRYYAIIENGPLAKTWAELDYFEMSDHIHANVDVSCLTRIVSGGAKGVDKMAERFAKENHIEMEVIPAEWNKFGRSAGFLRNQTIIEACNAVIVFWDGVSSGSKHAMILAPKMSREIIVIEMIPKDVTGLRTIDGKPQG